MVMIIRIIKMLMVMIILVMILWGLPLTLQLSRPSPPTDRSLHPDHTERVNRCNKNINSPTKSYIILNLEKKVCTTNMQRTTCMVWEIVSLSLRISARFWNKINVGTHNLYNRSISFKTLKICAERYARSSGVAKRSTIPTTSRST